jgi:hypothetical protein
LEKTLGALKYFAPSSEDGRIVVKPPNEAIEEGILKWSPSLVGQFLDKPLPFYVVKRTVDSLWAQYGKVEVFLLENGLYLFRFVDIKARDEVMEAKLWHKANKPLILRKWTLGMQLLKISLSVVPVWIKIHNLPIEFWNSTCLSYVASGASKPLCADSISEEQIRLGFARVLVEVDIDSMFSKEVEVIGVDGGRVVVGIEYPWLPVKCKKCRSFGHLSHSCTKVEKQVWIPKKIEQKEFAMNNRDMVRKVAAVKSATSSVVDVDQWKVVRFAKRTLMANNIVKDSQKHWTNSFHLLARANGGVMSGLAGFSSIQDGFDTALNEEYVNQLKDKGKSKMEGEDEVLMRGFSPTT